MSDLRILHNIDRKRRESSYESPGAPQSEIEIRFYWNSEPATINLERIQSYDIILNAQFGVFNSNLASDIKNLVSKKSNNKLVIAQEDDKLYVDTNSLDLDDPTDFLARYLLERG